MRKSSSAYNLVRFHLHNNDLNENDNAAENGNVDAQQNLATIYETGLDPDGESIPDVSVDYKTALKWFHSAAEQGSELAAEEGKNLYEKMKKWRFHPSVSVWGPQDELNSK